jgi:hypothetical protein
MVVSIPLFRALFYQFPSESKSPIGAILCCRGFQSPGRRKIKFGFYFGKVKAPSGRSYVAGDFNPRAEGRSSLVFILVK